MPPAKKRIQVRTSVARQPAYQDPQIEGRTQVERFPGSSMTGPPRDPRPGRHEPRPRPVSPPPIQPRIPPKNPPPHPKPGTDPDRPLAHLPSRNGELDKPKSNKPLRSMARNGAPSKNSSRDKQLQASGERTFSKIRRKPCTR
jgi:hypothetical protein